MDSIRKQLFRELGQNTLLSVLIFAALFVVLYFVELLHPSIAGKLLQWHLAGGVINWAFIVGIPASVFGTAYVLAIRNPQNYTGFYLGVVMSVLLALQFYLQGNYDLVVLYLCIFVPFQIKSLVGWRQGALNPEKSSGFTPMFLNVKGMLLTLTVAVLLVVVDYVFVTLVQNGDGWTDNWVLKLTGGISIAASFLANFLMIYKKNDAWLCWVVYCIANIIFFVVLNNVFSIVLFVVLFLINSSAQFAWMRNTHPADFGWAGSREYIEKLIEQRTAALMRRDGRREMALKRIEQWHLRQLERNRKEQAELLTRINAIEVKFGHIVDVVNRRIFDGAVEIQKGKIVRITEAVVPETAPYIMPGFYDSHIHIESTLLTPDQYARLAVEQGTIGVITDPHEIANVLGLDGVKYMIDNGKKVRFHFHFAAPACVPATPFETSGATIDSKMVAELLQRDEVYGLGEMMNVPGVLSNDPETMAKINATLAAGKIVDGHSPALTGDDLKKYRAAGISTDHECTTLAEARERVKLGMTIQIREGSAACDFDALAPIIAEAPGQVMFCSDDKYPDEIGHGYLNAMCRRAIHRGLPLWDVLTAACVTPLKLYGLKHGLLQVGDNADFIIVDNLQEFNLQETYIDGQRVVADGLCTDKIIVDDTPLDTNYPNHFLAEPITVDDIKVPACEDKKIKVIGTTEGSLLTTQIVVEPKIVNGLVVSDTEHDVLKLVCLSRHSKAKPVVGFIQGFGLKRGAIASTIGHDSHNIIALGATDEDIVRAINTIIEMKGGLVVVDGKDMVELALPIAGLMSYRNGVKVAKRHLQLKNFAERLGCRYKAPFMTMAFMSLSVIPEIKLTDKGLFDATKFEFTDLFV